MNSKGVFDIVRNIMLQGGAYYPKEILVIGLVFVASICVSVLD